MQVADDIRYAITTAAERFRPSMPWTKTFPCYNIQITVDTYVAKDKGTDYNDLVTRYLRTVIYLFHRRLYEFCCLQKRKVKILLSIKPQIFNISDKQLRAPESKIIAAWHCR